MSKRGLARYALVFLLLLGVGTPCAFAIEPGNDLPAFDIRRDDPKALSAATAEAGAPEAMRGPSALDRLRTEVPGVAVTMDETLGTPVFIRSTESLLTEAVPQGDCFSILKAYVASHQDLFGIDPAKLDECRVARDYVTQHNGVRQLVLQQTVNECDLIGAEIRANFTENGELINVASTLVPIPGKQQDGQLISAENSVRAAASNIGKPVVGRLAVQGDDGGSSVVFESSPDFSGSPKARRAYYPLTRRVARPVWIATIPERGTHNVYDIAVDAKDSRILRRINLTCYASTESASYRVYTLASPTPDTGTMTRTLETLNYFDATASPDGWINDGSNTTVGNNVAAYTDVDFNDIPDSGSSPSGSPYRVFDFALNLTLAPSAYRPASVAQLFYTCNLVHDRFYQLGFDEASENFQESNFGRGGLGSDSVNAEAQDGSGTNNANFMTPPDGSNPVMQMFIGTNPTPDVDGAFDTLVVIHEYAHGLSLRLVGVGSLSNTQQMGEGWSDWMGLALVAKAADDPAAPHPVGNYLFGYGPTGGGIRPYPYSTNSAVNPHVFSSIGSGVSVPHGVGAVWCEILWVVRGKFLEKYGFPGNEIMLQLVVDGMKLTPPSPGFIEARDAILQADLVNNGGENQCELWTGFAERGLGFSAYSASTSTLSVVNGFDTPEHICVDSQGDVYFDSTAYACADTATIEVDDLDLAGTSSVNVDLTCASGDAETLALAESPASSGRFSGTCTISNTTVTPGNGQLEGANGNLVTVTYSDANDGTGNPATVTDTATIDCATPVISSVGVTNLTGISATVGFNTGEPATTTVHYGTSMASLSGTATGGLATSHQVRLSGLTSLTTYYFTVEAVDVAGNSASDNNGGAGYTFATLEQADYFTEDFSSGGNDVDGQTLLFTPDASSSRYGVCREAATAFPTDPSGGTVVTLGDDGFVQVSLGTPVYLYGTAHTSFFIGSNGYVTFSSGDATYAESLAGHFNQPRISALFDDLNPPGGGTVSWKQVSDRVVVTFESIREYGSSNLNSFQIEMYFDGRIAVTHLSIGVPDGLVGLSEGMGVPGDFAESDLTSYTTTCNECPLPVPPSNPTPADGAVDVPFDQVDLSWESPDNGSPTVFDVYSGLSAGSLELLVSEYSGRIITVTDLIPSTTYYWQIVARNTCGTTPGLIWSATTHAACAPLPDPINPSPENDAVNVPVDTILSWSTGFASEQIVNGGFESMDFTGWTTETGPGGELTPWSVCNAGCGWFQNGLPFEGGYYAMNGFDGDAGLYYNLYQEIAIPSGTLSAVLEWHERLQWDLVPYGATLPRDYQVTLQPAGGGASLALLYAAALNPGTSGDTGYLPHSVDLLAAAPGIAGQTVRINFHQSIPETLTGPAQFDLDAVALTTYSAAGLEQSIALSGTPRTQSGPVGASASPILSAATRADYERLRADALESGAQPSAPPSVLNGTRRADTSTMRSTDAVLATAPSPKTAFVAANALASVAIFQNENPWGSTATQDVLAANGISYTTYGSADMGIVNLSPYDKVIIASVQSSAFYNALEANRAWFEAYVAAGGLLDLHLASFTATPVDGKLLPGGFVTAPSSVDDVTIVDPSHAVVTQPHPISDSDLDGWSYSTHGYFATIPAGAHEIIEIASSGQPCVMELALGLGRIIATVLTIEWSGASHNYLENTILYELSSSGACPTVYDVYFGTDPAALGLIYANTSAQTCNPGLLNAGTAYYWQVASKNGSGEIAWGPVWTFATGGETVFSSDFESGLGGFVIDNGYGNGNGLWHLTTACESDTGDHSTVASLYYGVDGNCNYNAGSTEGVVTTPVISLAGYVAPIQLGLKYFLQTEGDPNNWDQAFVEVSENGGPFFTLATNSPAQGGGLVDPSGAWLSLATDLSAMAGSDIRVRFRFRTGDDAVNAFPGFYVDDVRIVGVQAPQPNASLSQGTYSAAEGTATVTVTVNLDAPSASSCSLDYATSDGTAIAGQDYLSTNGTLNFAASETTKDFTVSIVDDGSFDEGGETFAVALSNFVNCETGLSTSATVTITDNDAAGSLATVYVSFSWTGGEQGTLGNPYSTFSRGLLACMPGGAIKIKGNAADTQTEWTGTISTARVIQADPAGPVRIGVAGAGSNGSPSSMAGDYDAYDAFLAALLDRLARRTSAAGSAASSGQGESSVRDGTVYEPVLPFTTTSEGLLAAQTGSALAIRLRGDAQVDPASIWGPLTTPEMAVAAAWRPVQEGDLRDIWVILKPQEDTCFLDGVMAVTLGADTMAGEALGPVTYRFEVESDEQYATRTADAPEPIWQPDYNADFDASVLDLTGESNDTAVLRPLDGEANVVAVAEGLETPMAIGPERVYDTPQRVWLPVPQGEDPSQLRVYYFHPNGSDRGWYPAENIEGWLVPGSYLSLEVNGTSYLGFLVRHAGIVQLGR